MGNPFVNRAQLASPVTCFGLPGRPIVLAFLAAAGLVPPSRPGGQAGAPAAVAPVRARARTNELDACKRRPIMGARTGLPGYVAVCCRRGLTISALAAFQGNPAAHD